MTRRVLVELVVVVAVLAALGVAAGVVWEWVWTPTTGVVVDHRWGPADALGLQQQFSGTGWYVVIGVVAGLVGGVLVSLVADRVPLATLAAVVVGSALAAWLMLTVGTALGPADPQHLAKTAADGTRLPSALAVSGRSPWISFPVGALAGLAVVFIALSPRSRDRAPQDR